VKFGEATTDTNVTFVAKQYRAYATA
jgi:hypothetical protein